MGRVLSIDYGAKRCGLAVTDPLQLIASPLDTVASHELMHFLDRYLSDEAVDCVVVGKPLKPDNSPSEAFVLAERFIGAFRKRHPGIRVEWIDERYSSVSAVDAMIRSGAKKKDRRKKGNIDKVSAAIILQAFLEMENKS